MTVALSGFPLQRQRPADGRARLESGHESHGDHHDADDGYAGYVTVKNGTLRFGWFDVLRSNRSGVKSFTQNDVDKRGAKIMRAASPRTSRLPSGDKLSATIITTLPPKVMTDRK